MQSLAVSCDTQDKLALVSSYETQPGFDFLRMPRSAQEPVEVLVTRNNLADFKEALRANGVAYEVAVDDVSELVRSRMPVRRRRATSWVPDKMLGFEFDDFPRYDEVRRVGAVFFFLLGVFARNIECVCFLLFRVVFGWMKIFGYRTSAL